MSALQGALTPYLDLQDGAYDCVDRLVLRAYFRFIQDPGGFRLWWRRWQGESKVTEARAARFVLPVKGPFHSHAPKEAPQ